jgi:hypothetical protein
MKVACLIGGEFRTFTQCFPTWDFLNDVDHDVFMSTWSKTFRYSTNFTDYPSSDWKKTHPNVVSDVHETEIRKVVGDRLRFLNIDDEINFDHRGNKQIYHWQKCLFALMNCLTEYDFALITRPDLLLTRNTNVNMFDMLDKAKLYGGSNISLTPPPLPYVVTVNDIFFVSSPRKLIDTLLHVPFMKMKSAQEINDGKGENLHIHLAQYFISNNVFVHEIEHLNMAVLRD